MKDAALLAGVLIILGGVGWYLFHSVDTAQAPSDSTGSVDNSDVGTNDDNNNPVEPTQAPDTNDAETPNEPVACTMDAKICPDGSAVGRTGPNCEFAACPGESTSATKPESITCSPESKLNQMCTREYAPVCGLVEVQCITTPCNPVPETFSNACVACGQGNVISYTQGACSVE